MLAEVIVTLVVSVVILVIAAAVFGIWMIVSLARLLVRGIGRMLGAEHRPARKRAVAAGRVCGRRGCGHVNPAEARFCTRCGQALESVQPVRMKRVAMW